MIVSPSTIKFNDIQVASEFPVNDVMSLNPELSPTERSSKPSTWMGMLGMMLYAGRGLKVEDLTLLRAKEPINIGSWAVELGKSKGWKDITLSNGENEAQLTYTTAESNNPIVRVNSPDAVNGINGPDYIEIERYLNMRGGFERSLRKVITQGLIPLTGNKLELFGLRSVSGVYMLPAVGADPIMTLSGILNS